MNFQFETPKPMLNTSLSAYHANKIPISTTFFNSCSTYISFSYVHFSSSAMDMRVTHDSDSAIHTTGDEVPD